MAGPRAFMLHLDLFAQYWSSSPCGTCQSYASFVPGARQLQSLPSRMVRDRDEWTAQRLVATQVLADVMEKALIRCRGGESAVFEVEACDAGASRSSCQSGPWIGSG
jgi:hypothetical protein